MNFMRIIQRSSKVPSLFFSNNRIVSNNIKQCNVIISGSIFRTICTTSAKCCDVKADSKFLAAEKQSSEPFFQKLFSKIPFLDVKTHKLGVSGYMLYESVADRVNYNVFFDELCLPDTFYSWFVVTELHVWMLMVRCMADGKDGRDVRNAIVQAMWSDVGLRSKQLGAANPAGIRYQIHELSHQFQAALIAYDEGLQGDDRTLAGAIWRRFYQMQEAEPEHIETLVKYTRKQIRYLDNLSWRELVEERKINWSNVKM